MELTQTPLSFQLDWDGAPDPSSGVDASRGRLLLWVGSHEIWGKEGEGFEWTWIELLEHLAAQWKFIEFEEADPLDLGQLPGELRPAAQREWQGLPQRIRDRQDELLWDFELSHNLASGIEGVLLPDVWLLRFGNCFTITSEDVEVVSSADTSLQTLESLGDALAARIKECTDRRSKNALDAWRLRRALTSGTGALEVATGLPQDRLAEIQGSDDFNAFWEVSTSPHSEIVALARSSGPFLSNGELRRLFAEIREIGCSHSEELSSLSSAAIACDLSGAPYDAGYTAARWLRATLDLGHRALDPYSILYRWNVLIREIDLATTHLDAVSVWGPRHGPAILLNSRGTHAQEDHGRRSTLAHEICHLVLDRNAAIPLGEAIGGRIPERLEVRARAFAAEFLAPREMIGTQFASTRDPDGTLVQLVRDYGASAEIIAWQARNSGVLLPDESVRLLRTKVSRPSLF